MVHVVFSFLAHYLPCLDASSQGGAALVAPSSGGRIPSELGATKRSCCCRWLQELTIEWDPLLERVRFWISKLRVCRTKYVDWNFREILVFGFWELYFSFIYWEKSRIQDFSSWNILIPITTTKQFVHGTNWQNSRFS